MTAFIKAPLTPNAQPLLAVALLWLAGVIAGCSGVQDAENHSSDENLASSSPAADGEAILFTSDGTFSLSREVSESVRGILSVAEQSDRQTVSLGEKGMLDGFALPSQLRIEIDDFSVSAQLRDSTVMRWRHYTSEEEWTDESCVVWIGSSNDGRQTVSLSIQGESAVGMIESTEDPEAHHAIHPVARDKTISHELTFARTSFEQLSTLAEDVVALPNHSAEPRAKNTAGDTQYPFDRPTEALPLLVAQERSYHDERLQLDVMFVYTDGVSQYLGHGLAQTVALRVAMANDMLARSESGINRNKYHAILPRLRLAALAHWGDHIEADMLTDMLRLHNPTDGYADWIHKHRYHSGADLVQLLHYKGGESWGLAGAAVRNIGAAWEAAFSVLHVAPERWGMNSRVMLHELGHNCGLNHQRSADGEGIPDNVFDYAYGYVDPTTGYGTVMASAPPPPSGITFSHWNIMIEGGHRMGTLEPHPAYDALALFGTAPSVAKFYCADDSGCPPEAPICGDNRMCHIDTSHPRE
jgi:hypothetical protein